MGVIGQNESDMNRGKTPESLYHYTTVAVLFKLFTGIKDGCLIFHASSLDFMNDSAEYAASRRLCKDYVDELLIELQIGIPFALCFSDSGDNIPMWSMYANGGKGICMKFNYSKLENYYREQKAKGKTIEFSQCRYQKISMEIEEPKPVDYPDVDRLATKIKEATFIKPDSFIHEREWRLTEWKSWASPYIQDFLFKEVHNEICPYIEIPIPIDSLEDIILNPYASEHMKTAVQLMRNKYAEGFGINVEKSKITLKV